MDLTAPEWLSPPAGLQLGSNEVHVWFAELDCPSALLPEFENILSADERERAARFHFQNHRNQYICGRGLLRQKLAGYLGIEPAALRFSYNAYGKPLLGQTQNEGQVKFNLAHSHGIGLV